MSNPKKPEKSVRLLLARLKNMNQLLGESIASITNVPKDDPPADKTLDYHTDLLVEIVSEIKKSISAIEKSILPSLNLSLSQKPPVSTWNVSSSSQQEGEAESKERILMIEGSMPSLMKSFRASYDSLEDFKLKLCFLCFSIFPEKCVIKKRLMISWWMAEDLVTSEDEGDGIFRDLMDRGLILSTVEEKKLPSQKSCTLRAWIRCMLIQIAKEVKFFNFDDSDSVLVLKKNDDHKKTMIKERINSIDKVFNLNKSYVSFDADWLSELKMVSVLSIGRWQVSPKHHIEIENEESLKGLRSQKKLKYLSLRGISQITKLPPPITELISLKILDLRACHNLEKLPPDISELKNLTHLDVSECYLLESMPRGLDALSNLVVLKGFVVEDNTNPSCQVSDLTRLKKLFKLSVHIRAKTIIDHLEFEKLGEIKSLRKLTISWEGYSRSGAPRDAIIESFARMNLPSELQKLDLRCIPERAVRELRPPEAEKLEKLYITGGDLGPHTIYSPFLSLSRWRFKILRARARHLERFQIRKGKLREMYPHAEYFDISGGASNMFRNNDEAEEEGLDEALIKANLVRSLMSSYVFGGILDSLA